MGNRILLIDVSHLFWSSWFSSVNDVVSAAFERTVNGVTRAISRVDGAKVAICCDSGVSFRRELSPAYKSKRPEKDHVAIGMLTRVEERLRKDGLLLWKFPGFEADDVIATACIEAMREESNVVTIATNDKDLLQLVGPCVEVLSTNTWAIVGETEVRDKFKVRPNQIGDFLALVGDKSDDIAGAPGIGPVKAAELLTAHGDLRGIYRALGDKPDDFKPAIAKSLSEHSATVDLARKLVTLRTDVPLKFAEIFERREQQPLTEGPMPDMDVQDADFDDAPQIQGATPSPKAPDAATAATAPAPEPSATGASSTNAQPNDEATAIALRPVSFDLQLQPTSVGGAYKLARGLFESRLYQRFQNAEAIMAVIMRGREMGLGALTSLDSYHIIEGRPAPHAHLIIARAKADPDCEYFQCQISTAATATWETKNRRNPKPTRMTYTIEQAKLAGVIKSGAKGPGPWLTRPEDMLAKTSGVKLARMEYPSSALGLYAWEELGGDE